MAFTIEDLQIEFESNDTSAAVSGINALAKSLERLKRAVGGDLSGVSSNMNRIAAAMRNLKGVGELNLAPNVAQLKVLSGAAQALAAVNGSAFESNMAAITRSLNSATTIQKGDFSTVTNSVKKLIDTVGGMDANSVGHFSSQMSIITASLSGLSAIEKGNIGSVVSQLKQIPDITKNLDLAGLDNFSAQVGKIASGMAQLNAIEKGNLGSVISQLKKIPEITKGLDPTTLDQFAAAIEKLTVILAPLASEMDRVSRGFSMLPPRMRAVIAASNQVELANRRVANSYGGLFTSITRTITKLTVLGFAFRRVVNVLSDALDESNNYIENLNLFRVTMGGATDEAMEFAQAVQDAMGIDISQWIENQGVFMRMASGFGIAEEQAQIMSQNLTQLAYDMSSFFNTDVQTAMQKLQSGMSGQIKGLKAWGYNLSVAALQETAHSLGIKEKVRNMTEAQKAQLRYITLIQKSEGVMGDMARTLVTPANSLRILGSQFTQLKRAIGDVVSVIAVGIIPYAQALVEVVTDAARALAAFLGFELPTIDYSGLELGSDVIDGIGEGIDESAGAAEKLKKQLMGFDELNVLNDNNGGGGAAGGASYDLGFEMPSYDFLGDVESKTEEIKEQIKGLLPWIAAAAVAFAAIKFGPALFAGFKTISNLFAHLIGKTTVLTAGASKLAAALKFAGPIAAIAVMAARFVDLYISSEQFRVGLERVGEIINGVFTVIGDVLGGTLSIFKDIGLAALDVLPEDVKNSVLTGVEKIGEYVQKLDLDWKDLAITIAGIGLLFVPGGQILGVALLAFEALTVGIRALGGVSDETWKNIKTSVSKVWENIKAKTSEIAKSIVNIFKDLARGTIDLLSGQFTNDWKKTWNGMSTIASSTLNIIGAFTKTLFGVDIVNIARDWFNDHIKPWFSAEKWKKIGTDAINSLWDGLKEMWDNIERWWDGLGLSEFKIKTPHITWSTQPANGWIAKTLDALGLPTSIPKMNVSWYANGGFPATGEMFIAREAGPELVGRIGNKTTVANNDQIVAGITSGVQSANDDLISVAYAVAQQIVQAINNKEMNTYIDTRKITAAQQNRSRAYGV